MAWKTYAELMAGEKDEEIVQIYENIVVPLMCGSKVIHVRTHEEKRLEGICETLSDFDEELEVLHICSDSGVISIPLFEEETGDEISDNDDDRYALHSPSGEENYSTSAHCHTLNQFIQSSMNGILLFIDSDKTLERDFQFIRMLKTFSMSPVVSSKYVILHTVEAETPNTLSRQIQFYDLPLPKYYTLKQSIQKACNTSQVECSMPSENALEEWARALGGLTSSEAARACKQTLFVHEGKFSDEALLYLRQIKRDFIEQTGIMEFTEPTTTFADIGGLNTLIEDLSLRRKEFEDNAKTAGLQSPKGSLLVGLPGTGKSLIAQSIAGQWQLPLLEFNMANVLGSFVGESEKGMREVLSVAESLAPCVLMVDEIDKALSGLGSSSGDSGVTRRIIGTFLTWLNDRKSDVYVIATANDLTEISRAMPEMLRKGRWDDIWWVELPGELSRFQIIQIHLSRIPSQRLSNGLLETVGDLAKLNSGCTGAELAAAVNEANRKAYHDGERQISYSDLEYCINQIHPLSSGIPNLSEARSWMKENARLASSEETPATAKESTIVLLSHTDKGFVEPKSK
jgi:SpoVK/Ycf46/Vps4 family AAA+-type ATPase